MKRAKLSWVVEDKLQKTDSIRDGKRPPLIALLTDFGVEGWYAGTMKAVIKSICPEADIIDLSHGVAPQAVTEAALMLSYTYLYFPEETIFVVVIDPGVGTAREPVILRAESRWFIAPNNGSLSLVAQHSEHCECRKVTNTKYFLPSLSHTFHGRDLFAPVAAHLAAGVPWTELAEQPSECFGMAMTTASYDRGIIEGNIVYFDHFGNAVTNIPRELFEQNFRENRKAVPSPKKSRGRSASPPEEAQQPPPAVAIYVGNYVIPALVETYGNVKTGEALAYWGSTGNLEIGINHGNAHKTLSLKLLDKVTLKRVGRNLA